MRANGLTLEQQDALEARGCLGHDFDIGRTVRMEVPPAVMPAIKSMAVFVASGPTANCRRRSVYRSDAAATPARQAGQSRLARPKP